MPGARANPVGGTVTQGTATFQSQGSQFTIKTSAFTAINWQSFNIGVGQTTTFIQPSSSSVVWNRINDPNPSQILGNLNANGYVILQNQSGFYFGGQASVTSHGLMLTTSPIPIPDLTSGGAWQFNALPPTASIINYGQINVSGGGSAFLIANNIENHGSIIAPGGNIGLYSGKEVLISERPDGRGLSAAVTLPEGSVDNSGNLIADAGTIAMHAKVVNQGGLVQANSVRDVNGVIEFYASDAVNLGANSVISAQGDNQGSSPGGTVTIKSANTFADQAGSTINISGGAHGGNAGQVEISAPSITAIHSSIDGHAAPGSVAGKLTIDPDYIVLADSGDPAPASGTVNPNDPPSAGSPDTLTLDVNSFNNLISHNQLSQINLQANLDITLNTVWNVPDSTPNSSLTLQAGRNITLMDGTGIQAGRNWNVNLVAGTELTSAAAKQAGMDGIYLFGSAYVRSQNGNINLMAGSDIFVDDGVADGLQDLDGNGFVTKAGGNINATAIYGDVNSGGSTTGYTFGLRQAPYYQVSPNLGGISTYAGGSVNISAPNGSVTSFLPLEGHQGANNEAGIGAYGSQPGNVTINAGQAVHGHFVLANGVGSITSIHGDVGDATATGGLALSLIDGSWNVYAPQGSIYVQEVRNPNGIFNAKGNASSNPGYHRFGYGDTASVLFDAADSVEITGLNAPRVNQDVVDNSGNPLLLFPPTLEILAGSGGFKLDTSVTLFPSPDGNLTISTSGGGNFIGTPDPFGGGYPSLAMSDSGSSAWTSQSSFSTSDHAKSPPELNNGSAVVMDISGSVETLDLYTTKKTTLIVGGDLINTSFSGENMKRGDATTITVAGNIYNTPGYTFTYLNQGIVGADPLNPSLWSAIFQLAVNPALTASTVVPNKVTPSQLQLLAQNLLLFPAVDFGATAGFVYDSSTKRLGFQGVMPDYTRNALEGKLETLVYDNSTGLPVVVNGHFQTRDVTFAPKSAIDALYNETDVLQQESVYGLSGKIPVAAANGYQLGGPGTFDINAGSLNLGNSLGILSWGIGDRYANLAKTTVSGAAINVDVTGDIDMLTSTIASFFGGDVNVVSTAGSMNLGSQDLFGGSRWAFGIYTSGHSDVSVTADKDINISGSRIASYDGGKITVESLTGNVNAGTSGNLSQQVPFVSKGPAGQAVSVESTGFGSGILAETGVSGPSVKPGDITVSTPQGDIVSTVGGIQQLVLNGTIAPGPKITLTAGTPASGGNPAIPGNINLGNAGVIGGTVDLSAQGNISGLVISKQNTVIQAAQSFSGTVLSGGSASVSATAGTVSGTIIGVGSVNVSGQAVTAEVLSQNATVQGQTSSTLGATATATATAQQSAQESNNEKKDQALADSSSQDDDLLKKGKKPVLTRRIGRVTVILPKG